jgi:hypothetical protein
MVAHNPLHGSGQAAFPHSALTSGNNAHAAQGIRMTGTSGRQPAVEQAPHPVPKQTGVLTAAQEHAVPEPANLEAKHVQRSAIGTRTARSPVNFSTPPSRAAPHYSGPMWVASPLSYDSSIHYTSPV